MIRLSGTLALVLLASVAARADVVIPHLGRLMKSDAGSEGPVTGAQKLKFGLYTRAVDGPQEVNLVWEDTYPNVQFTDAGVYHVDLGDTTPLTLDDVSGNASLWLQVTVFPTPNDATGTALQPRLRLEASALAHWARDAAKLGGRTPDAYALKADLDAFKADLTGGEAGGGLSVPWAKLSGVPAGLEGFGAVNVADYAKKTDVEAVRTDLTGSATGTTIPWEKISGVPGTLATALQQVATTGAAIAGTGLGSDPLRVNNQGIDTAQLKDGAVTAAKIAAGAITPGVFQDGTMSPAKLTTCPEGQILKVQSGSWQCGVDTGSGGSLSFNVLSPLQQVAGSGSAPATLQLQDGGIATVKLANDAIDASKLKTDAAAIAKLTGSAIAQTAMGAIGLGVAAPTARLEAAAFDVAGTAGTGSITYVANATTITNSVSFVGQVLVGDLVQLGNLGWKTVTTLGTTTLTVDTGYPTAYSGSFSIRRATLRTAGLVETGLGYVGLGTPAPLAALHVSGSVIIDGGGNANLFSGTGTVELNRYFALLNSPLNASASGLKAGGVLVADTYAYANPGKNDLVVKGNVGIGVPNPGVPLDVAGDVRATGNLKVGGSITSAGNQIQRDVFQYNTGANNAVPLHLKTEWRTNNSAMYRILVEGYNYGAALAINSDCVGYLYSASDSIVSGACNNYAGGVQLSQYRSSDGYLVIKVSYSSSYYIGLTVSTMTLSPTGAFNTTFTPYKQAANL